MSNPEGFVGGIKLANGKELPFTTTPEELWWFYRSDGFSVTPPKKTGKGKSKGARTRGRKGVKRTVEEKV